jgi:hypothetical protein
MATLALCAVMAVAACGTSTPTPGPSRTPSPTPAGATNFAEYATAFCSAWGTLFRVVGNPETATWTEAVLKLKAAAEAHDGQAAARLANEINPELATARGQIAVAGGWPPAAQSMAELDRFFAAEQVWITAYANLAAGVPNAPDAQTALESAGGIDAWMAWMQAHVALAPHRPASVAQCPGVPVGP